MGRKTISIFGKLRNDRASFERMLRFYVSACLWSFLIDSTSTYGCLQSPWFVRRVKLWQLIEKISSRRIIVCLYLIICKVTHESIRSFEKIVAGVKKDLSEVKPFAIYNFVNFFFFFEKSRVFFDNKFLRVIFSRLPEYLISYTIFFG